MILNVAQGEPRLRQLRLGLGAGVLQFLDPPLGQLAFGPGVDLVLSGLGRGLLEGLEPGLACNG